MPSRHHEYGSSDIERVQSRRRKIEREIKDAKLRISALTSEDQELEIAERVILRLSGNGNYGNSTLPSLRQEAHGVVGGVKEEEITGKPSNTPTMPFMITEALQYARYRGKVGLEPKEMTEYIAGKWWPDVTINNVGPIAWRMWKRGEVKKSDSTYSLPRDETPDPPESGAAIHHAGGGGTPSSSGGGEP